jgi:beta-lactamase class D
MLRSLLRACTVMALLSAPANADEICTLIADAKTGAEIVRDGICDRRVSPMSSFKLPLAVMGFDSGILIDEHNPRWDWKPEFGAGRDVEKGPHDPESWEKISVVWYSQELTRKLGDKRFADYVVAFGYGNGDVAGNAGKKDGLTQSWLMSSLLISPDEQIAFLKKLKARTLPVSAKAYDMTARILPAFEAGAWKVQGKTGSGWLRNAKGEIDRNRPIGWFVGWGEKGGQEIVFARLFIGAQKSERYGGMIARDGLLADLRALLK